MTRPAACAPRDGGWLCEPPPYFSFCRCVFFLLLACFETSAAFSASSSASSYAAAASAASTFALSCAAALSLATWALATEDPSRKPGAVADAATDEPVLIGTEGGAAS